MKRFLKKFLPERVVLGYHRIVALAGALRYGFPSRRMLVVGVTGTKGKTSTANFIWAALQAGGWKTGIITTANIRIGEEERMNQYHMTMPGRFALQRLLREMADAGCAAAVVETTSEGIKQFRHAGIAYDIGVFTNLTPEHLRAHHGSFDAYRSAKGKLFAALAKSPRKSVRGIAIPKIILANRDSEHADFFLGFPADEKATFGFAPNADWRLSGVQGTAHGVTFRVRDKEFSLAMLGAFNSVNALPAIVIANRLKIPEEAVRRGLRSLAMIPGRMERIHAGQPFHVIVDYAHERESMHAALDAARALVPKSGRVIVLLGAEGGGRDTAKRPLMGEAAAAKADFVVVSNVDPYDDDPVTILEDIARAAEASGKAPGKTLFVIEDRRAGIAKALALAAPADIVLITGKGAEQSLVVRGAKHAWDDRRVAREELSRIGYASLG